MLVSIFNDVVGPVMRGPSSSHCAAALRIGRLARDLMGDQIDHVLIEFDRSGSLPATHESQGSDMGLFGGLLGWDADDSRLPNATSALADAGISVEIRYGDYGDEHPNTYRLTLTNETGSRRLIAVSTGGGMIEVIQIDDAPVSIAGDYDETLIWLDELPTVDPERLAETLQVDQVCIVPRKSGSLVQIRGPQALQLDRLSQSLPSFEPARIDRLHAVLPVRSRRNMSVPFRSAKQMHEFNRSHQWPLWKLALEYESARSGMSESELIEMMIQIVRLSRESIRQGLAGTQYDDRVLGPQAHLFVDAHREARLADGGVLNQIVPYISALMEVKSSLGVIVAAPTAGACAAFPAVCVAMGERSLEGDDEIARAMFAGGLIGVFIATDWSFAAEVGGCQAEGGSAAAMSAAAITHFLGGTAHQSTGAASMALQNMLGLICDPVANRVEVPCLGKNVLAASNALSCANMAMAGFDAVIPLDETIAAAKAVAEKMPREHRCTALGGLAMTPTSIGITKRLKEKMAQEQAKPIA